MSLESKISNIAQDNFDENSILPKKEDILNRKYILKNRTIGISISESENLNELGFSVVHLRDLMIEVSRYILALGGRLAYGGDMRQDGFTELMFDLLAYYKADKELEPYDRFKSFISWPLYLSLSKEKEAELKHSVSFKRVLPPKDVKIDNLGDFLIPNTTENLYVWSRCLTRMRSEMEDECNARIFVGGRSVGFKGKCPGVLEEILIAIEHKHPIYLVGAFGGVAKDVICSFDGEITNSISDQFHFENSEYKNLFEYYNANCKDDQIDYKRYFKILNDLNFEGVSKLNGLSISDNKRLAVTPHTSEIIYLILKGLTNIS